MSDPPSDLPNASFAANANEELHTQIQYRLIEKLSESERRYRELVENLREIVFRCDNSGYLTFLNQAWTETLGHEEGESLGRSLEDFLALNYPESAKQLAQCQQQQTTITAMALPFRHHRGQTIWLELSARSDNHQGYTGSLIDITARKQAEENLKAFNDTLEARVRQRTQELQWANQQLQNSETQLRSQAAALNRTLSRLKSTQSQLVQTEKMSSLGQLVAGVTHEINNPINFIEGNLVHAQNYTQSLLACLALYQAHYPSPPAQIQALWQENDLDFLVSDFPKLLTSMQTGAARISQIVNSLRDFSRLNETGLKPVDIHQGIDNTLMVLSHRLRPTFYRPQIEVIQDYGPLPMVHCHAGDLNQVFMNLLANAFDALDFPKSSTSDWVPTLRIRTTVEDGDQVMIAIADNGIGMTELVQRQIFDPFFTTKPVGEGTGLGLSISYKIIVERHQGTLTCDSTLHEGSEFRIILPIEACHPRG